MKKSRFRRGRTFAIVMLACFAFLVGAVKIWGTESEKIWSGLIAILVMLGILMALAFVAAIIIVNVKKLFRK